MKILFAAPSRDLAACYESLLSETVGETNLAYDGVSALSLLEAERFDLAILDDSLPRISCKQVLREARQKGVPSIVLIGGMEEGFEAEEPSGHIAYPFFPDELMSLIHNILAVKGETA